MPLVILILSLTLVPMMSAHAAVIISEVAWMGDATSASNEWIELYNDGSSAVDLTGWRLADNNNLSITLSGSLSAGAYAVLERGENAVPSTAFLIYSGALVNSGATLSLYRANNQLEDRVSGGENWQSIGGDNTTKETAQYTSSGWITAAPTPGARSAGTASETTNETEEESSSQSSSISSNIVRSTPAKKEDTELSLPGINLELTPIAPTTAYVNQVVNFDVGASGIGDSLISSLKYSWNFGDLSTATGKTTSHRYRYPGKYEVTVYGKYKRQHSVGRHSITVLPVSLSLTRNRAGDLQINNDSRYEIDLSGYQVVGNNTLTFPARSYILENQTITIPKSEIKGRVRIHDDMNQVVTTESGMSSNTSIINPATMPSPAIAGIQATAVTRSIEPKATITPAPVTTESIATTTTTAQVAPMSTSTIYVTNPSTSNTPVNWPHLALAGILGVGLVGVWQTKLF